MSAVASKPNGRAPRVPLATAPTPESAPAPIAPAGTPHLDAAVLRVQAAAPQLIRNAQGQIGSRTYGYVTNDQVVGVVLPLLVAEELVWRTFPTVLDGEPALRYRMTHVPTGEYDEDTMLLLCDRTSQGQGSGNTYARRYSLVAYLNLTVDPDDDGHAASMPNGGQTAHESVQMGTNVGTNTPRERPSAAPAKASERPLTANQRTKLILPRAKQAGLSDGELANILLSVGDAPQRQWRSDEHAAGTLARLLDRCPARLKDDVLDAIAQAGAAKAGS